MGQACVGGAACDLMKARSNRASPAACTATVTATKTPALRIMESIGWLER
jgi:hypothetical protein